MQIDSESGIQQTSSSTSDETKPVLPAWHEEPNTSSGHNNGGGGPADSNSSYDDVGATGASPHDAVVGGMSATQRCCIILAHLFALSSVGLVAAWVSQSAMGGGGVSWAVGDAKRVFNWHPVFMILAFAFMTSSSLAFRMRLSSTKLEGCATRRMIKGVHSFGWISAACFGSLGIVAVVKSHNDAKSGYIANMYSLHSWIGVTVIALYAYQFVSAATAFGFWKLPGMSSARRLRWLSFHRYLGTYVYIFAAMTIMMGIQEKEGFVGCAYTVDNGPDTAPWENFGNIPPVCRISHALGLMVFLTTAVTTFALYNFPEHQAFNELSRSE